MSPLELYVSVLVVLGGSVLGSAIGNWIFNAPYPSAKKVRRDPPQVCLCRMDTRWKGTCKTCGRMQ